MENWLVQIKHLLQQHDALVLVTVLRVKGSVPRRPGATMCVTAFEQCGTIGGGQLEFHATDMARDMLVQQRIAPLRRVYPLGPAIGQCCGGTVELLFELLGRENSPLTLLPARALRRAISNVVCTRFESVALPVSKKNRDNNIVVLEVDDKREYLLTSAEMKFPEVWVFGAGHVGRAVIAQLSLLPCQLLWLDQRDDIFPHEIPASVSVRCCDGVVDELRGAPNDAYFVVMTHSHALDFEICHAVLQRPFKYLGLIGSKTKAALFKKRLLQRGLSERSMERLVCPVGNANLSSNEPHAIALSLALQLVAYW